MRGVQHQLLIRNATGEMLTIVKDRSLLSLSYGLKENEPSVLEFTVPASFPQEFLDIDYQIEIYRIFGQTKVLEGETAFFIRKISSGEFSRSVTAYSAVDILKRRIVGYYAGTSYADKENILWDNLMREVIDENYGPGASYAPAPLGLPERNLEPWLRVEADKNAGASYSKAMAWRNILEVLQEIVQDVRGSGTKCSFDVVLVGPARYEFRVYIGPRGIDHSETSTAPVIVSKQFHNLGDYTWEEDWTNESNFIYGTGQGEGNLRIIETAQDDARIGISPFNRHEYNRDARQGSTSAFVQSEANAALDELRPVRIFTGTIIETKGCIYNIHWKWGDIVTVWAEGKSFDCYVDAVVVTVDSTGVEHPEGYLRSVESV